MPLYCTKGLLVLLPSQRSSHPSVRVAHMVAFSFCGKLPRLHLFWGVSIMQAVEIFGRSASDHSNIVETIWSNTVSKQQVKLNLNRTIDAHLRLIIVYGIDFYRTR